MTGRLRRKPPARDPKPMPKPDPDERLGPDPVVVPGADERLQKFMAYSRKTRVIADLQRRLDIAVERGFQSTKIDLDTLKQVLPELRRAAAEERKGWAS